MMVWRKKGRDIYQAWIYPVMGERVAVSTEAREEGTAVAMAQWADDIAGRGDRQGLVAAIAKREIKLAEAYHLGEVEAVAEVERRRTAARAEEIAADAAAKIVDVWPHLTAYAEQRSRGKKPVKTAFTALAMAQHVFPENPCPHTLWEDADEIERRLTTLQGKTWKGKARPMSDATRNRYKSVLSVQADHLRRLRVIQRNVLPDVSSFAESSLDFTYLELADAKSLIDALDEQGQITAALALGFGMEWSAIAACEARDLDLVQWSARPRGEKTHWRDRLVHLSDVFAFLQPILRRAVDGKLPRAKLVTTSEYVLLDRQADAAKAVGVQRITLHQWRHSCAVILLQAGESATVVAHILGHKDTSLVIKRYGRFQVRADHYVTRKTDSATKLATGANARGLGS